MSCIDENTCVCGYRYACDLEKHFVIAGDEEFIPVSMTATYETDCNYGGTITNKLSVSMCPKCGTLKGYAGY